MGMALKMSEAEFNIILYPNFIEMGVQRDKPKTFAEYGTFSIRKRKCRRSGNKSNDTEQEKRLEQKSCQREEQNFFKVDIPRRDVADKGITGWVSIYCPSQMPRGQLSQPHYGFGVTYRPEQDIKQKLSDQCSTNMGMGGFDIRGDRNGAEHCAIFNEHPHFRPYDGGK
eukprot:g42235.t1